MVVRENGSKEISIPALPYTTSDVNKFFSHLAFEVREYDSSKSARQVS